MPPSLPPKPHGLPLRFSNLAIPAPVGHSRDEELLQTLGSSALDVVTLGPLRRSITNAVDAGKAKGAGGRSKEALLIDGVEGVVHQGELLLLIGPPAAPTSTLLRALSSPSDIHLSSTSKIDYGLLDLPSTPLLRSEVVYLDAHDVHFASLPLLSSIGPSAASLGLPHDRLDELIQALGLGHATGTKIGSPLSAGLSGGERKRASILEALLTDASCFLLDAPTNGLDSSTALALLSFLKKYASEGKKSVVVTAPQLSDTLLEVFDKVLLLDHSGRQVYFGSPKDVVEYFRGLGLGFKRREKEGEGTVEFLLNCVEGGANDLELERAWRASPTRQALLQDINNYVTRYPTNLCADRLIDAVKARKSWATSKGSRYTSSFATQVGLLTKRQYALIGSELPTYVTKTGVNVALSVLAGTLFWMLPHTTEAAFTRGSVLLLSIMFNAYLSLAELGKAIEGRAIVKRQSDYGFFRPSALALARIAGDLPLIGAQVILFGTMTYVLTGLQRSWSRFGVYMAFVYVTALNLSCMFRMAAAFAPNFEVAIRFCGVALNILVISAGYFIPTRSMAPWSLWIHYVLDPISRAYEAVLANEFRGLNLTCSPSDIVPSGPTYTNPLYQTCLLPGSTPQSLIVDGEAYLSVSYGFHYNNIWWNLLVMVIQALVFLIIGVIATDYLHFAPAGSKRVWGRTRAVMKRFRRMGRSGGREEEEGLLNGGMGGGVENEAETSALDDDTTEAAVEMEGSVLVWKDLSLWVDTPNETRRLLDRISGYIRPGRVCALLGASGAGKSTLLNVLAGRAPGAVRGSILVDGQAPTPDFYRTTGYVEQFDLHDDKATVRECLEFSALLRQDASLSRAEKLAYVDVVLDLLDLTHLQDAIVGSPTAGLDSCSRKLLSIAVEVVSKPKILFADEPTTGLNAKSALRVVKLLRRLARTGLAICATIHQPSSESFETFDDVLLLQRGGKQLYYGPRGNATSFFDASPADSTVNHADLLLSVAGDDGDTPPGSGTATPSNELGERWKTSAELSALRAELEKHSRPDAAKKGGPTFGASTTRQCVELTKRVSRNLFRDVSYSYTKLFTSTVVPIIIGLTFFQEARKSSIVSFQNRMFSVFLLLFVPVVIMNVTIFKVVSLRGIWKARELPCKIYGRTAFATSLIVSEIPYSILCATIYFVLWYFLVGFPLKASTIIYTFAMLQTFWFFVSTWALWIVSLSSSLGTVANLLPFFLVSLEAFNGSLVTYEQIPIYYKWVYWISPFQWYVKGMLGVLMHGHPIECDATELATFVPPKGLTCGAYLAEYLSSHPGYLVDAAATSTCRFCKAATGDDWLVLRSIKFSDRWLALGVLIAYTALNVVFVYVLVFFPPRLPGWLGRRKSVKTADEIAEEQWAREEAERAGVETLVEGARDAFS
ncbi:ABC drug exporter AtrF [Pseudohyphozyma bogoriensis]|nr:ABC drug exporter AtrF [Pseudohyphozyma bogoriensis]